MHARCVIELDGAVYGLEVETLSHRRFTGEGATLHTHPSYHLILVSQGSCRFHRADQPSITAAKNSLIIIDPLVPHGFTARWAPASSTPA